MKRPVLLALVVSSIALAAALLAGFVGSAPNPATAASHREAPLISLDGPADNTDTFFFRSYEPGQAEKVVLVMNVSPGEEPSAGPNYWNFDPNVRYSFNIDNNQDGQADDVVVSFDFDTEIRGVIEALDLPVSYFGGVAPVPPITALDGHGSEGLGLRQTFGVTIDRGTKRGFHHGSHPIVKDASGKQLIAVPSNVGPRTMPNYDALAAQGIYDLGNGIRVFAGQRNDPFYIDLGAVFDSLNLRRSPPLLTALEDLNDNANPFGFDMISGFSVHTIAIELPASMLTSDGQSAAKTHSPKLGLYAATSRPTATVRPHFPSGNDTQVSRLANPLVNELIIGTEDKDEWNAGDPDGEEKFVGYYLKPRIALAFQLAFGFPTGCTMFGGPTCSPNPPANTDTSLGNFNRTDLVNILLKYSPSDTNLSELLRLDLGVPARPLATQSRLGLLGGDPAGYPNGRRPKDDVVDITIRVAGGPNYIAARAGDGVNRDISPLPTAFPFIPRPSDGRNLNPEPHVDPTP
ncbi:MAG: DUF4331 domain-containing protein [Actinobacteria bacterium]|nr:DUF4331 domain-containing protein [Actinomycetota bacterium]